MTAFARLMQTLHEQDAGGAQPAPAPAAPAAAEVSTRDGLAGLFAAYIEAEDNPAPAKAEQPKNDAAAPAEAAAAPETAVTADPATTEQDASPAEPATAPAIDAPSGMSEADRAEFAKLPPAIQSWVSKRVLDTQADYTRKTQEVAERRKAADAMAAQLQGQLQEYHQILTTITGRNIAPPDPALRMSDPGAFEEQLAGYLQAKHAQEIAAAEQKRVRGELERQQEAQRSQYLQAEAAELQRMATEAGVPVLAASTDEGRSMRKAVYEYGIKAGFTAEMLSQASAKDMLTLWKAQQYDAAKAAKSAVKPVPAPVPRSQVPGPAKQAPNKGSLTAAVHKLSQSGSRDALADAYLALIDSE